ncbi:MAG: type IV pilus secretin PilQ [Thermodesulfobacteriota bacterium]
MLAGVTTEAAGRQTRVVLKGDQPFTYTAGQEEGIPAIVVDVGAGAGPEVLGETTVKKGLVEKIAVERVEGAPNASRVRIMLVEQTPYEVVREGADLVVLVENVAGGAGEGEYEIEDEPLTADKVSGGTAQVTAVDFRPLGKSGRSRLMIKTTKLVTPNILTRDGGRTVILSLAPAVIPAKLTRPLDTTYFRSAVNYVKPASARGRSVEMLIRLRDVVPYHLGQKGLVTYLDFDQSAIEPRAAAAPGLPAPGEPAVGAPGAVGEPVTVSEGPGKPKVYTGARISLDFQNADIHNILRLIGEVSGKNVVVSERVTGKVTLKLEEVPWDQALDIVLKANELDMIESGNVLRIDKADFLQAERERDIAAAEQALVQAKKVPLEKRVFTPKYAAVSVIQKEVEKLKSDRGKLTVIGNDIYVEDEPLILASMQEVFEKNDKTPKQILIEARIVEALSSFSKNLGVNWGGTYTPGSSATLGSNTVEVYGAGGNNAAVYLMAPPTYGIGLGFGILSEIFDIDANLYAMEQTGEGRIVSAPRILASNDEEVYIKQGQSIPYESSGTTTTPATITYNEAVLELKVKPHIEENGKIVTMDITVTKDTADYSKTTRNPPINKREAKTKLMVKNGETVVIGGIIIDEQSKSVRRVPGLHRIPVLGWLFKSYDVADTKLELLIFLTSNIIPVKL